MKKICYFFVAVALCVGFVGCSDDNDNDKGKDKSLKSLIVGTWELYKSCDDGDDWDYDYGNDYSQIISFNADGTGTFIEKEDGSYYPGPISWEIVAETYLQIKLFYDEEPYDYEDRVGKIKIEKNELIFDWGDGEVYYYRRVK